ncbi:type IV secretory system conjugative DNA transfer family protein [Aeromonas jandaei]|uniref:type IV secretory system conjugative DNA transfer family protein n=1 Tax=Aeromonas jandaei TaxID=650 RepID=UPI003B9E500A
MISDLPPEPPIQYEQVVSQPASILEDKAKIPPIRYQAISDGAFAYGAQAGNASMSYKILKKLEKLEPVLNRSMRFELLMLDKNVVPPVLVESHGSMSQDSDTVLRLADATYKIERPARFTTVPLSWRDYLLTGLNYDAPLPIKSLLPRNSDEKAVWEKFAADGWVMGEEQAEQVFIDNLHRMERDIAGMVIYRNLLAKKMVTEPYVAQSNLGVTGDGASMNVNDRVLRITVPSALNTDSGQWAPRATPLK